MSIDLKAVKFGVDDGIKLLVGKTLAARPVAKCNSVLLTTTEGRTYHVLGAHFGSLSAKLEVKEVPGGARDVGEIQAIDVVEIPAVPVDGIWDASFSGLGLRFHFKNGGSLTYRADGCYCMCHQDGDNAHVSAWEWSVTKVTEADGRVSCDYERTLTNGRSRGALLATLYGSIGLRG